MASLGRSFKPSYLSSMTARRPGMPGRSLSGMSSASERSSAPDSPCGDLTAEDLIYSTRPSPAPQVTAMRKGEMQSKLPLPDSPRASPSPSSHPIAIELPPTKKPSVNSSSVYTPPAPLSARGDLPGGYFPLHEEQNRVYRSHPFHLDASKARSRSIQHASSQVDSLDWLPAASAPPQRLTPPARLSSPGAMPSYVPAPPSPEATNSNMPVASYIPSGVHANPLPMGKYYPSNYENHQHIHRPTRPGPSSAAAKTDSQVPTYRDSTMGHSRNESEAKRRLQQYQRDMIAQATLALNGGGVNAAAMNTISLRNLGFTSLPSKPSKPRLAPLGSPGPVTPMNLESSDDGYLGIRLHASESGSTSEEVIRAIRAEEERRRLEGGSSSPAVELGSNF